MFAKNKLDFSEKNKKMFKTDVPGNFEKVPLCRPQPQTQKNNQTENKIPGMGDSPREGERVDVFKVWVRFLPSPGAIGMKQAATTTS